MKKERKKNIELMEILKSLLFVSFSFFINKQRVHQTWIVFVVELRSENEKKNDSRGKFSSFPKKKTVDFESLRRLSSRVDWIGRKIVNKSVPKNTLTLTKIALDIIYEQSSRLASLLYFLFLPFFLESQIFSYNSSCEYDK